MVHLTEEYQVSLPDIVRPIYEQSVARRIFPVSMDLEPSTQQLKYYEEFHDLNWSYDMDPDRTPESDFAARPATKDTPVIHSGIRYGYDELKRINNGRLPIDARYNAFRQTFVNAEESIALTGTSVANSGVAVTSVSSTGTNSTAVTGTSSVSTLANLSATLEGAIGQIVSGLGKVPADPMIWAITPDVYTQLITLRNTNTDKKGWDEALEIIRRINPNSEILVTKYLGGTLARGDAGKMTFTAGTTNGCLFVKNPQYYKLETSMLEPRTDGVSKVKGLYTKWVERFLPVFYKKEAIIYMGTLAVS